MAFEREKPANLSALCSQDALYHLDLAEIYMLGEYLLLQE